MTRLKKLIFFGVFLTCLGGVAEAVQINGQLEKAGGERLSSAPTSFTGRFFYNTTTNKIQYYNASQWVNADTQGSLVTPQTRVTQLSTQASPTGSSPTAPTTFTKADAYIGLGGIEYNTNSYRLIGFGYTTSGLTHYPAYIGYNETANVTAGKGDLVFMTRTGDSDTQPVVNLRIASGGASTFTGGVTVGGNTTSDSNLGTISSVTNSSYYVGSFTATFTGASTNFSSTQTITVTYQKSGRMVTLSIPSKTATCGSGSVTDLVSDAIPSAIRPLASTVVPAFINDNNAFVNAPGALDIETSGTIDFNKTVLGAAFTASQTCGWKATTITYVSAS